jgi:hypothetical protein
MRGRTKNLLGCGASEFQRRKRRLKKRRPLRASRFTCTVPVRYAALGQVVGREFHFDPIARKNLDAVTPQTSGDMGEDNVAVIEFDGERGARKDLLDRSEDLDRRFLRILLRLVTRCDSELLTF